MTIELLETLFALAKRVKKPIVKIFPDGRVIGSDESFASLNIVIDDYSYNINLPCPFIFVMTEITSFMRTLSSLDTKKLVFDFPYCISIKNGRDQYILDNHIEMNYNIDELYNSVVGVYLCKPPIYSTDTIKDKHPDMFSLKMADGARMFNIDWKFLMSSFNSIHPASKPDKVSLIIRDNDYYSYIAEFVIYKKKENYELHEILRFRKL